MLGRGTRHRGPAPQAVYPPREDTALLLPFAHVRRGALVLDIGTGNGAIAERAAERGARVVATDLNRDALLGLARRARRSGRSIDCVRTDLAAGLRRFDRILSNPPYLPTPEGAEDPDPWVDRALNGGPDGWSVTVRLLGSLASHLTPTGRAFVLISSLQEERRGAALRIAWRRGGGSVRVVARRRLEGEELRVWELRLEPARRRVAPRTGRSPEGTGGRPRTRRRRRSASNPATARGRTRAPDAASARRRSPRGS